MKHARGRPIARLRHIFDAGHGGVPVKPKRSVGQIYASSSRGTSLPEQNGPSPNARFEFARVRLRASDEARSAELAADPRIYQPADYEE